MSDVNFQRFSPHLKIQYKCFTVFFLLLNVVWIQDGWAETFVRVGTVEVRVLYKVWTS